jgi:glyoxylase-like metal-dependent hydrolase (beta-lactamase superfamily II)
MRFGDVEVTPLIELARWQASKAEDFFPDADVSGVDAERYWLEPEHIDRDGAMPIALEAFLVRTPETTVLVDTNLGDADDEEDDDEGAFGALLEREGVDVASIDVVVNTHMHGDHIGGNTVRSGDGWVPRFPNAKYIIADDDISYWRPRDDYPNSWAMDAPFFVRTIQPLLDADMVQSWSGSHRIDPWLEMIQAPGHTPGLGVLQLQTDDGWAVFVGDLIHHAVQLRHPEWKAVVDEDGPRAHAARVSVLGWAADNHAVVVPGHFPGPHALRVKRDGQAFSLDEWVPLS